MNFKGEVVIKMRRGFPGGLSGTESACQCRRRRFDPWSGEMLHATGATHSCAAATALVLWSLETQQLSPRIATAEAPVLQSSSSAPGEAPTVRGHALSLESSTPLPQPEKACVQRKVLKSI